MNPTIDLMKQHRSIRKFINKPIAKEVLSTIIDAACSASSSSFLQVVSIIRVTDPTKRQQLVSLTGNQAYVGTAAEFLIFCIDYNRHQVAVPDGKFGYVEHTLIGAVDAGIMAQNALLSAQSVGLGGVFIGAIRNDPNAVCELLSLPKHTFPLFGLCLGTPDDNPLLKPRLPPEVIVNENVYKPISQTKLNEYDTVIVNYYKKRTGSQDHRWTDDIASKLSREARPSMQKSLQKQGLSQQ